METIKLHLEFGETHMEWQLEKGGSLMMVGSPALLAVVNGVTDVGVLADEDVEHREDLAVVRDEGLADEGGALLLRVGHDQGLQHFQSLDHHCRVARVERGFDGDDELGDHGQHLRKGEGKGGKQRL